MQSYRTTGEISPTLTLVETPDPVAGANELLIDIKAASLNYRDLIVAQNNKGVLPLSDGAGVVSAIGKGTQGFEIGDRIVIGFMPGWVEGEFSAAKQASSLGGASVDGVLTQHIAVAANAVVRIPETMSFEEASTLPCAGVTAWSALFERRPIQPGETVLLLGTGGVSIFALQLAKLAGARVIITSSSNEKLARARTLGADHVVNYRTSPDWVGEVLDLTGGLGVDLAIDVAGPETLNDTLKATRHGGRISLMGVLTGFAGPIDTASILNKRITLQGIYVGSVAALRALCATGIKPQVDEVFPFEKAEAAYESLRAAGHFGKLVIRVG